MKSPLGVQTTFKYRLWIACFFCWGHPSAESSYEYRILPAHVPISRIFQYLMNSDCADCERQDFCVKIPDNAQPGRLPRKCVHICWGTGPKGRKIRGQCLYQAPSTSLRSYWGVSCSVGCLSKTGLGLVLALFRHQPR